MLVPVGRRCSLTRVLLLLVIMLISLQIYYLSLLNMPCSTQDQSHSPRFAPHNSRADSSGSPASRHHVESNRGQAKRKTVIPLPGEDNEGRASDGANRGGNRGGGSVALLEEGAADNEESENHRAAAAAADAAFAARNGLGGGALQNEHLGEGGHGSVARGKQNDIHLDPDFRQRRNSEEVEAHDSHGRKNEKKDEYAAAAGVNLHVGGVNGGGVGVGGENGGQGAHQQPNGGGRDAPEGREEKRGAQQGGAITFDNPMRKFTGIGEENTGLSEDCKTGFDDGWSDTLTVCENPNAPELAASQQASFIYCRGPRPFLCRSANVIINTKRISGSTGGEEVKDVMGRSEEMELPRFVAGALELGCRPFLAAPVLKNVFRSHMMETMLDSIREVDQLQCQQWDDTPTVLIARLDYADLLHAFTEIFHTYIGLRSLKAIDQHSDASVVRKKLKVIFLDGHAKGPIDPLWSLLFDETVSHVHSHPGQQICARNVLMVPPGPIGALFEFPPNCNRARGQPMMSQMMDYIASGFGIPRPAIVPKRVLILQQKPRLVHPRQILADEAAGQILNLNTLLETVRRERKDLDVKVLVEGEASLQEIFEATQAAQVVVSLHSAPNAVWMNAGSTLILITHPRNRDMFFRLASNLDVQIRIFSPNWISNCQACDVSPDYLVDLLNTAFSDAEQLAKSANDGAQHDGGGNGGVGGGNGGGAGHGANIVGNALDLVGSVNNAKSNHNNHPRGNENAGNAVLEQVQRAAAGRRSNAAQGRAAVYLLAGRFSNKPEAPGTVECFGTSWDNQFDVCSPLSGADSSNLNALTPAQGSVVRCYRQIFTDSTTCIAHNLVVDASKIVVSAGGEEIMSVLGRREALEMPRYTEGGLSVACTLQGDLPRKIAMFNGNYMTTMMKNLTAVASVVDGCRQVHDKIGVFITREEYANLFHAIRDIFNTYHALRMHGIIDASSTPADVTRQVQVIWLDGHAKGSLDEAWETLFGRPQFVSQVPAPTCFAKAIFVHPGPRSVIHQQKPECGSGRGKQLMDEFSRFVLRAYGLQNTKVEKGLVTIVGRRKYLAHPRMNMHAFNSPNSTVSRVIVNEDALVAAIARERPDLTARLVYMSPDQMTFGEQVQAAVESEVLVAFHGAAMAHLIFTSKPTSILELSVPRYRARNHFALIARNMGSDYMMHIFPRTAELPPRNSDRFVIPETEFLEVLASHIPDPNKQALVADGKQAGK